MVHVVQYRAASGEAVTEEVPDLDAALDLVTRLRNDDRAENVRVFEEVPLRFETYVQVSVAGEDAAEAPAEDVTTVATDAADAAVQAPVQDDAPVVEPPPGAMPLGPAVAGNGTAKRMFSGS